MSVFVCGSLHLDVIVGAPHLPALDETVTGHSVAYAFGGKGGNQAVAAAKMGARTAMAGRVGSDGFAEVLLEGLAAAGVDAGAVQRGDGASGMSVAIVTAGGDYGAVIVSGANLAIKAGAVALPEDARVVLLQNEVPEVVNLAVARRARSGGVRVVLNAAPMRAMAPELLGLVDLLVVNRVEAAGLLGRVAPAAEAAEALARIGPASVCVTLGGEGLVLCDGGTVTEMAAHAVAVASTHGAGDAFIGAMAARLDLGDGLVDALNFARAAAALYVATPVADRGGITPAAVRAFQSR